MKASAAQLRSALDRPGRELRLILLHGPDEAAAHEHVAHLARSLGDDAERVDLEGATLKSDPARLADEAASLSLFGTSRYVRVTGVGEESLDALTTLLGAERAGNLVIAVAPGVRTTAKIVALAQQSPSALAFACYAPEGRDAHALASVIAQANGLRLGVGVAARLLQSTNNDRATLTREIEKLALYLDADPERPRDLDGAALDALLADSSEAEIAGAVDALITGDATAFGDALHAFTEGRVSPIPWLRAAARKLMLLAELRNDAQSGDLDSAMTRKGIKRREERQIMQQAIGRWSPPRIATAIERVRAAERAAIAPHSVGEARAGHDMLALAQAVKPRR